MGRPPQGATAVDFAEVVAFLKDRNVIPAEPSESLLRSAKVIHGCTYSLILWRFRLIGLPVHSQVFLDEMASDALQILPQVLMGYNKTSRLLTRGVIENALRHLYFSDHRVEFARLNRDKKWYVGVEQLFEYARHHFDFIQTEAKFDALGQMSSLYSELSSGVHGSTVQDLEMRTALARISFDEASAQKQATLVSRCAQAVNFVLAIYHRAALRTFEAADRRILLRAMPAKAREVWMEHE